METVGTVYPYEMNFEQYKVLWGKIDGLQFMGHVPVRIDISVTLGNLYVSLVTVPSNETAMDLSEIDRKFAITQAANVSTWEDARIFPPTM